MILPTDTVYGLCATVDGPEPGGRLYALKRRDLRQPSALLAPGLDALLASLPELDSRAEAIVRALLPGPYTLVLPNPARRFAWIAGETPEAIGVRVPSLPAATAEVLARAGCVVATSANLPGGRDPRRLDEIPAELLDGVGAVVDGGELPGTPSTVLDFSTGEPRIIREGAAPGAAAIARAIRALA